MVKVCNRPPILNLFSENVLKQYKLLSKLPGWSDPYAAQIQRMNDMLQSRSVTEEEYMVGVSTDNGPDHECPFGSKNLFYKPQ